MKKKKLNSKNPKYHKQAEGKEVIKRKYYCTTPSGAKVYGVWYKN
tara:strand:+ start:910 stop:1044 length:135 start_codon:yes stop_codon:yes gene_type:complete